MASMSTEALYTDQIRNECSRHRRLTSLFLNDVVSHRGRGVIKMWFILGVLGLIELLVLARIRVALLDGIAPLNPAGWLGYAEYLDVPVERRTSPSPYWFIPWTVFALSPWFGG